MLTSRLALRFTGCLILGALGSILCEPQARAAIESASDSPTVNTVGANIGLPLSRALAAIAADDYESAQSFIAEAEAVANKAPHEQYKITEIRAYAAVKVKDFPLAESLHEELLNSPEAEAETHSRMLKTLVQLAFTNRHFDKAAQYGSRYLSENREYDGVVGVIVANSYYLNRDFAHAEAAIDQLLKSYKKRPDEVQFIWLRLKLSCAAQLRDEKSVAKTRKQLAKSYPQFKSQLLPQ
jgi:hypothetical protein